MSMLLTGSAAIVVAAAGFWTADDPFVGTWRLDVSRSLIVDRMVVEAAGPNRYTFRFEGGPAETVVADGTDQPGVSGTTLAVTSDGPRMLKVVRKQGGHVVVSAHWTLSADGRTLRDSFAAEQPDAPTVKVGYPYRRTAGTAGFAGAWESTTQPTGLKYELKIEPYAGKGFSFVQQGSAKSVTFDGQEHAVPGAADGVVASGRRTGERAAAYTQKMGGKVLNTYALAVSPDGRTLTMNVHRAGQATPDRLVLERE